MSAGRHVRIFRNGRNQAVRIPREFELPGNSAVMFKDGNRLIIGPAEDRAAKIRALLEKWRREPPLEEGDDPFDFDDLPPEPVDL